MTLNAIADANVQPSISPEAYSNRDGNISPVEHPEHPKNERVIARAVSRKHGKDRKHVPDEQKGSVLHMSSLHGSQETTHKSRRVSQLRRSQSAPGMSRKLSQKFSSAFGQPTVVHRPNLRSRPSIDSIAKPALKAHLPLQQGDMAQDSSSYTQSGVFSVPTSASTDKTFFSSARTSVSSGKNRNVSAPPLEKSKSLAVIRERYSSGPLTPVSETRSSPSIATVETTATAKIFFETHFNGLLEEKMTPRDSRFQELKALVEAKQLTPEEEIKVFAVWARQESEYLRQNRVLKTKALSNRHKSISVAGYEVVRILGKGSFGVVRLVKEKNSLSNESSSADSDHHVMADAVSMAKAKFESFKHRSVSSQKKPPVKNVYAMKVIRKSDMLRNSQEGHLRAERDFLVASEKSRWVIPLIASFQDHNNLYLVMDYMVGGDFLGLLIRKNILSELVTRHYIAEMILCIEEAHKLGWIHRDVKPDNFLISANGHLKISDFGLAFDGHWSHNQAYFTDHRKSLMEKLGIQLKGDEQDQEEREKESHNSKLARVLTGGLHRKDKSKQEAKDDKIGQTDGPADKESILQWRNRTDIRKLARSIVGTSQYMAPEIIKGEPYDGRCDWWSIGIIIYEVNLKLLALPTLPC